LPPKKVSGVCAWCSAIGTKSPSDGGDRIVVGIGRDGASISQAVIRIFRRREDV